MTSILVNLKLDALSSFFFKGVNIFQDDSGLHPTSACMSRCVAKALTYLGTPR